MSYQLTEEQQAVLHYLKMYSKGNSLNRQAAALIELLAYKIEARGECIRILLDTISDIPANINTGL